MRILFLFSGEEISSFWNFINPVSYGAWWMIHKNCAVCGKEKEQSNLFKRGNRCAGETAMIRGVVGDEESCRLPFKLETVG
jgi:hypothetical protein